jgi:hydroxymethylpyrimidine pyrophosphatase-like HAD family hydrolase
VTAALAHLVAEMGEGSVAHEPLVDVGSSAAPLALIDLFNDAETLSSHLRDRVAGQQWLDAFLLAAGLHQMAEDRWHRGQWGLRRAGGMLTQMHGTMARLAGALAEGADHVDMWARSWAPGELRRRSEGLQLTRLVHQLCRAAMHVGVAPDPVALNHQARMVSDTIRAQTWGDEDIVRLPSCFRSFDQRLTDVARLASTFADRWPDRQCPLTVVGVRTSGSYLGPATVVALERFGYSNIAAVTIRPEWPIPGPEQATIASRSSAGGRFLVVDDPPATGRSLATAVGQVRRAAAVRPDRVTVLVALGPDSPVTDDDVARRALGGAAVVSLPWEEWSVHRQLLAPHVSEAVTDLLPPGVSVSRVDSVGSPTRPARGHVQGRYRLELVDATTGSPVTTTETIVVEGVGLGYLGRHALAVAQAAPALFPEVLGFADGMLYRRWLPTDSVQGENAGGNQDPTPLPSDIARYIDQRKQALGVPGDRSLVLTGRQPAWEVASRLVSRSLGPLALPLRVPVVDPLARRLLHSSEPSVVDGNTTLDRFIRCGGRTQKVRFADGPFSHVDLATYDAVFDLAGAAADSGSASFARALRHDYATVTGTEVDPERWLLYRLTHLWHATQLGRTTPAVSDRRRARVVQEYFAERFLDDLPTPTSGNFAAVDLDGVLETSPLGFPATTVAGALALRALRAHNVRLLLVTGRSLPEVIERCHTYGATGGVAEYGAALYDHERSSVTELVAPAETLATERLRAHVTAHVDVEVDGDYRHIVRVFRRGPAARYGLDGEGARILAEAGAGAGSTQTLDAVLGELQTDFVPAGIDKGAGLAALVDQLGCPDLTKAAGGRLPSDAANRRVALAIGDSTSDAGFLALADQAFAPANAHAALASQGVHVLRGSYQVGLFQAVTRLVGHRPGSCSACRAPEVPDAAHDLLALLSVQENGPKGAPRRLSSIAARAWVARRSR